MAWIEAVARRTQTSRTWEDTVDSSKKHFKQKLKTALNYPAVIDSGVYDEDVDMRPQHVTAGGRDLWRITANGWHYALGMDIEGDLAGLDGTIGFGGRQGQHWFKYRLVRVGYLHWATKGWQDVGGAPTYSRANLSMDTETMPFGPEGAEATTYPMTSATWEGIWSTPGGGRVDITWRAEGLNLKEEVVINQVGREWIEDNAPPETPASETWFGFVFRCDISDIPQVVKRKAGTILDFDDCDDSDGDPIQFEDALGRLLAFMPIGHVEGPESHRKCQQRIWRDGTDYYLLVGVRCDRLVSMEAGPLVFDPSLNDQPEEADAKDTCILSAFPTYNLGTANTLYMTRVGSSWEKALIEFDLSSIPADATCDDAWITLTSTESVGTHTNNIHEIASGNAAWPEGTHALDVGGAGDCCYSYLDQDSGSETSWAGSAGLSTSGTDYVAGTIGTIAYPDSSSNTEAEGSLNTSDVEDWFGGSNENYGILLLEAADITTGDWHSSSAGTAGYRPEIDVDYTEAGGGGNPWYVYAQQ